MVFMRPYLLRGMILPAFFLFLTAGVAISDPMPVGEPRTQEKAVVASDPLPRASVVRNPHGFLQFDGTGYRVVTKEVKPEKTNHIRLKPVGPSGPNGTGSTVYTLEVLEDRACEENNRQNPSVNDGARIAVERVEELDKKKNATPEPRREHKADVGLGMKVSESSEVMVGRGLVLERREDRGLESRDDGWRFRFKTNF